MAKLKIVPHVRGEHEGVKFYFTSYRLPKELCDKLDIIAQYETQKQEKTVSYATTVEQFLTFALENGYGKVPRGFKSRLKESKNARKDYGKKKAKKATKKAPPPIKKAAKKVAKKAAKKAPPPVKKAAKKVAKKAPPPVAKEKPAQLDLADAQ